MGALYETAASLRFFGEDLDPDEVTALLGGPPTAVHRAGDMHFRANGSVRIEPRGRWSRAVERRAPGDLDGQIRELFLGLTEDMSAWTSLAERYRGDVFCGLFLRDGNEGITLRPKTLLALGLRGLDLDLDIYGPE